jgi:hypothetical protein
LATQDQMESLELIDEALEPAELENHTIFPPLWLVMKNQVTERSVSSPSSLRQTKKRAKKSRLEPLTCHQRVSLPGELEHEQPSQIWERQNPAIVVKWRCASRLSVLWRGDLYVP